MGKYRKKPIVIEAIQWNGTSSRYRKLTSFCASKEIKLTHDDNTDKSLSVHTLEGIMKANVGDYIIKGVQGEIYPCKPDIFEATYEIVAQ